jgi:hypothetical protein
MTSPVVCASQANIDYFFANYMNFGRFMAASLLILDTGINANEKDPYSYMAYEKTMWLLFNQKQQIVGQVFIATY